MDLVFCGTPQLAVPTLEKLLHSGFRVALVVTQPDRPRGRGLGVAASPIKQAAAHFHLPILQPERIQKNAELRARLESLHPRAIVVVGYGRIIPKWMIELPPLGNINLHASLLPAYRGAAPVQWAIAKGETTTGVTTMRIDEGLDTGDILLQQEVAIRPEDTAVTLGPRLAEMGADLMVETLRRLEAGTVKPGPQDGSRATNAPLLTKEDGRVDFSRSAAEIHNRLRGFQPWPGAYTTFRGKNLKLLALRPTSATKTIAPGELAVEQERLLVGCGQGTAVELIELQPEGRKRLPADDFIHGYRPLPGEELGNRHGK